MNSRCFSALALLCTLAACGSYPTHPWAGELDVGMVEGGTKEERDLASIRRMSPDGQAREIHERLDGTPTRAEQVLCLQLFLDALDENRLVPFLELVGALYLDKMAQKLEDPEEAAILGVAIYSGYVKAQVPEGKRLDLDAYLKSLDSAGRGNVIGRYEREKNAWLDRNH